jgi:hypothetical protein
MLTEPTKPNESGQTMCVVRWQVNMPDGLWLGAWDKEAFEAYTAPLLARIAGLEADAKRYLYLRDEATLDFWCRLERKATEQEVDAAIDAAMKEQP